MQHLNYLGEVIKRPYVPRKDSFIDVDTKIPKWKECILNGDDDGFSITEKPQRHKIILEKGKKLCRYGQISGNFLTDLGTPFEKLSLPYEKESLEYHEYEVVSDIDALVCYACTRDILPEFCKTCIIKAIKVDAGIVAPGFEQEGMGIQYKTIISIKDLLNNGKLKEDFTWQLNL